MQITSNYPQDWFKPSIKFFASALLGAVITLATFSFMVSLLTGEQRADVNQAEEITVLIMEQPQDSNVIERERPVPPKPQQRPPVRQERPSVVADPLSTPVYDMPDITTQPRDDFGFGNQGNRSAMPLVRVPPQYPAAAARDGIEGYVILSYDVSPTGQVINAKVIDAQPKRTFDKDALRALRKWKFNPTVVDGVAKVLPNQQVRLDFNLQQ